MTDRILEIAGGVASLHVRLSQLVIARDDGSEVTTPLSELGVLVVSHPRVLLSQAVVAGIAEHGGAVVICDGKHAPAAMMLPLQTHTTQAERFARQAAAPLPLRKRLWQQIVRAKLRAQGRLLRELYGDDAGLLAMAERVRSGDRGCLEAQASRRYWPRLFADPHFRRGRPGPDQNSHLDYGYAVLRATTARALCAAGLHPSLGLQHHNRYDTFCLASDLMEPFRPVVDRAVHAWMQEHDPASPLDKEAKAWLLQPFTERYRWQDESRTLFDLVARAASSLGRALMGEKQGEKQPLELPEI